MREPQLSTKAERDLAREIREIREELRLLREGGRAAQLGNSSIELGNLILGDRSGKHLKLGPEGMRQFEANGIRTLAIGAGSALTNYLTIVDADTGNSLASIAEDGSISATGFNVIGEAVFDGTALPQVIDSRLIGDLQAHFSMTATSATTTSTLGLIELAFTATANSYYEITTSPVLVGSGAGDDVERCTLDLRYTTNGSTPTVTSPLLGRDQGKDDRSFQLNRLYYAESAGVIRLLLTLTDLGTGGVNVQPTVDRPLQLYVKRVGKQLIAANGGLSGGGGGAPLPQQVTRTYHSTWSRKWDKDSIEGDTTTPMVQGNFQDIHGDWRSVFGFNQYDAIRDDLAGATIDKCELYLYASHWVLNTGGFARVRTSALRSPPGNNLYPNDVSPTRWVINLPKPGGKWTDVGVTVGQQIRDGTVGSFALDATDVAYNAADAGSFVPGRETAVDNRPALRVTYTK